MHDHAGGGARDGGRIHYHAPGGSNDFTPGADGESTNCPVGGQVVAGYAGKAAQFFVYLYHYSVPGKKYLYVPVHLCAGKVQQ